MDSLKKEGVVIHAKDYDADTWDDSVILKCFDTSIKNHRTKNDLLNGGLVRDSRKAATDDIRDAECESSQKRVRINEPIESKNKVQGNELKKSGFSSMLSSYASSKQSQASHSSSSTVKPILKANSSHSNVPNNVSSSPLTGNEQHQQYNTNQSVPSPTAAQPTVVPHLPLPPLFTSPVEAALTEMLLAWYQSGYATGRYQTLLEMQQNPQNQQPATQHAQQTEGTQENAEEEGVVGEEVFTAQDFQNGNF